MRESKGWKENERKRKVDKDIKRKKERKHEKISSIDKERNNEIREEMFRLHVTHAATNHKPLASYSSYDIWYIDIPQQRHNRRWCGLNVIRRTLINNEEKSNNLLPANDG